MDRVQVVALKDDDAGIPVQVCGRSDLREWLADGTMTRADVRRLYRDGHTVLSGTGGAMPQYSAHWQDDADAFDGCDYRA